MTDKQTRKFEQFREISILAIVPGIVGILILMSWVLSYWKIGPYYLNTGLAFIAVVFGGFQRFIAGFKDIYHRKITVNVFIVTALIATVSAGEFRPAAIIVFIMAVTGALEYYTLDKSRKSIRDLLDLSPKTATVKSGEKEISVNVSDLKTGDVIIIRPGEHIPVDGVVIAGASCVNQAPITGESMPVEKVKGNSVFSGTFNETGRLEVETARVGEDTTLARIVHLVEKAQERKAPIQNIADRFTAWFLPVVLVLAVSGFFVSGNIKVAVSILLVACPCAFAIATPTAVTAGISNLARRAVLVKGGKFFEQAGKITALLIDKTGTFTLGEPKVMNVIAFDGLSENDVLRIASIAEKYSEHPLAKSIIAFARERKIDIPDPDEFKIEIGMGVTAEWSGKEILVGKEDFLFGKGISINEEIKQAVIDQTEQGKTSVLVTSGRKITGLIAIADEIRPETLHIIESLKKMDNIKKIVMLTGDNHKVAESVAKKIRLDDFQAGLLPEQKQEFVKKLQGEGYIVGMIGDGINDAPALAMADVGIAMGAAGTDTAIETADVILMNDDLTGVLDFMRMSKIVLRRIKLNIFFSIIYNVIGLTLSFFGMMTPILAVAFQEAGCISVVLSSTLLLWVKLDPEGRF
ncbi:MAG: cation-translocating P-type ATPase [bacterium]|nr:cation-translocating P-type ATPase [bacterium]